MAQTREELFQELVRERVNKGVPFDDALNDIRAIFAGGKGAKAKPKNTGLPTYTQEIDDAITEAASITGLPKSLITAQMERESSFKPQATGRAGEIGLMQIKQGTFGDVARKHGDLELVDPWNVRQNTIAGSLYLKEQLDSFGDLQTALGAYNAGPGCVLVEDSFHDKH